MAPHFFNFFLPRTNNEYICIESIVYIWRDHKFCELFQVFRLEVTTIWMKKAPWDCNLANIALSKLGFRRYGTKAWIIRHFCRIIYSFLPGPEKLQVFKYDLKRYKTATEHFFADFWNARNNSNYAIPGPYNSSRAIKKPFLDIFI